MNTRQTLLAIGIGLGFATAIVGAGRWASDAPTVVRSPLGDTLPALALQTPDGKPIDLRVRLGHKPAVLYVFNQAECLGCSDLGLEFRVIRREAPGIEPLLIGSGSPPAAFARPLTDMHLEQSALIDEHRALLKALGVAAEPLVMLVSADGRILLVDTRNTSRATLHPMGELIRELKQALGAPGALR